MNSISPVLAAMIGLGVGIDYALFIVTRHRENLRAGMTVEEAAGRAIATSGAAVLFAGATVVIAICGLAIAGIPAVTVMGLMAAITVAVMVAISLTLLPALLGFAGQRIDAIRVPGLRAGAGVPGRESMWHRWGRQVSAHPWRYLVSGVLVLGLLAAPAFAMRLGMTDNGASPQSLTTRQAYDLLADGFGPGFNGPLVLAVDLGDATVDDLAPLAEAIAADPGVAGRGAARAQRGRHGRRAAGHPDHVAAGRAHDRPRAPPPQRRHPRGHGRHRAPTSTSAGRPPRSSTCPTRWPTGCPASSGP